MAEIAQNHRKGPKRRRTKKLSTRVDFTPMVDLGFLLITFFMLATTLNKPQTMEIALPSKEKTDKNEQTTIKASRAITILLGKNNAVYYYEGTRENEVDPVLVRTNFSPTGLRSFLVKRNNEVMSKIRDLRIEKEKKKFSDEEFDKRLTAIKKDKNAPIVLIKATDDSVYRNLIDALDEMAICNIDRYAIDEIAPFDLDLIEKMNAEKKNQNGLQ
ncbi:MAG: biopolymer transporter ExbD [Prolixibacteraceae bacterium]|jgi:biopolymer transport protein ExbD|nr:biopolymer transporter ExbD [Prolixibacteraceae bacterium]